MAAKAPKRIDKNWLEANDACPVGLRAFVKLFPRGLAFTPRNVRRVAATRLRRHLPWFLYCIDLGESNRVVDACDGSSRDRRRRCVEALVNLATKGE